jgi:hypothetical protein
VHSLRVSCVVCVCESCRPSAPPEDWPTGEAAPEVITVADDDDLPPDEPAPCTLALAPRSKHHRTSY